MINKQGSLQIYEIIHSPDKQTRKTGYYFLKIIVTAKDQLYFKKLNLLCLPSGCRDNVKDLCQAYAWLSCSQPTTLCAVPRTLSTSPTQLEVTPSATARALTIVLLNAILHAVNIDQRTKKNGKPRPIETGQPTY